MGDSLYISASGALAQSRRIESVANNLANSNTTGFKRDDVTFREHLTVLANPEKETPVPRVEFGPGDFYQLHGNDKSFVTADAQFTDFSQGPLKGTSRMLDVAIEGKGFLEIGTPQGIRYTRNGALNVSAEGVLVNHLGYPVLSKAPASEPEAALDVESRTIRLNSGPVTITENGDVFQNNQFVLSLQVTEFTDPSQLQKEGNNLLRTDPVANPPLPTAQSRLVQRHLEASNVNPVQEMTTLLEAQRMFEQNIKGIQQTDVLNGRAANDIGKF